jgi:multidrug efflux pump subunit AcrA (membrane-fusion protein)
MQKAKATGTQKLVRAIQLARARLAQAESSVASAKEQARLAKRRRKEARQNARLAKKQVKQTKAVLAEAKEALAKAESKLQAAGKRAAEARRRAGKGRSQKAPVAAKAPLSAPVFPKPSQSVTKPNAGGESPARVTPPVLEAPAPENIPTTPSYAAVPGQASPAAVSDTGENP